MSEDQISEIRAEGDYHKYYIEIPNMVDDIGLSVYAFRLYAHLKRITWERGVCWRSTRTLAEECCMSLGSVSNAKTELLKKELVRIEVRPKEHGEFDGHYITLVDIWKKNFEKYFTCSPDEQDLYHQMNRTSSPHETIKNPSNKNPKKKRVKSAALPPADLDFENMTVAEAYRIPEIQIFREVTGRFPGKPTWRLVCREIGKYKTSLLRDLFEQWCARGYKPQNLAWLTEWAPAGGPTSNGNGKQGSAGDMYEAIDKLMKGEL